MSCTGTGCAYDRSLIRHFEYITLWINGANQSLHPRLDTVEGLVVGYQHVDGYPEKSPTHSHQKTIPRVIVGPLSLYKKKK
jgi:hypothetical protein